MIRKITEKDIPVITKYYQKLDKDFKKGWIESDPFCHIMVYEKDRQVVAFIEYSIIYERAELNYIFVEEAYRKRGIAHSLLKQMEQHCNQKQCHNITLEVRKSNEVAQKLYQNEGFNKINIRKHYYGNEDAILMEKVLG